MEEAEHLESTSQISPEQKEALTTLSWGLMERASIKAAEDELARRKSEANIAITLALVTLKLKNYIGPEGSLTLKNGGTTSSLNKEKLVGNLLGLGIAADRIKKAMDDAITTKPKLGSIEFEARKE